MDVSTIRLYKKTKSCLDAYKEYRNESYDEIVMKLVDIAETARKEPQLSKKTMERIEAARKRIKSGNFATEDEARRRLGL